MWNWIDERDHSKGIKNNGKPAPLTPPLSRIRNEQLVSVQARRYVDWIIESGRTDLYFYPLRKRAHAHSNIFRRCVLGFLTGLYRYSSYGTTVEPSYEDGFDYKRQLDRLTDGAIAMGYTIHVMPTDPHMEVHTD